MLENLRNKLQSGQPRSLIVVRPATFSGFISGALNLAWLVITSLATEIIYIAALIVGAVVGLAQVIFRISVDAVKSPFTSPSKKTIGDNDGQPSGSAIEPVPLPVNEVDDLRPRHLFVEPYDGVVDEQRGTEMHTPDDFVGPGTVENLLVPVKAQPEISTAMHERTPKRDSEKTAGVLQPVAVFLLSPAQQQVEKTSEAITHPTHPSRAPVVAENVSPLPIQAVSPAPVAEKEETRAAPRVAAEPLTTKSAETFASPEPFSFHKVMSPEDRFTRATLEDRALISDSARRSDAPSPSPHHGKVVIPETEQGSFDAPETPKIEAKSSPTLLEEPVSEKHAAPAAASQAPPASTEAPPPDKAAAAAGAEEETAAPSVAIEEDTEPAIAALPNAKPTVVDKDILPAAVLAGSGEHRGKLKKATQKRRPFHKLGKAIRKAFH